MAPNSKNQIDALTSTRAIAAILVFIHHFGFEISPFNISRNIFHSGNIAVGYFFVLSGFVLYIAHHNKPISYIDFVKKRLARIAPLYYIALVLTMVLLIYTGDPDIKYNLLNKIILHFFFLQAFIPGYPITLNLPAWTISVEMFFYFLFPVLLRQLKLNKNAFIFMCFILFAGSQITHIVLIQHKITLSEIVLDTICFSPFIHLNQFLIGMIGGLLYVKYPDKKRLYSLISVFIFILILFLLVYKPAVISYHVGLIAPIFMILILAIAKGKHIILTSAPLIFLGEISYGIYILQFPVYRWLETFNSRFTHFQINAFFYFSFASLILSASILHFTIEKPIINLINRSLKK